MSAEPARMTAAAAHQRHVFASTRGRERAGAERLEAPPDPQQARYLFEKMLGYANPLGLFSEQLGRRGEFLGNIPQAFTHLSLISAAFDLDRRLSEKGLD
jgi:GH15 family glucan-1,4-alpha-glucosidase